MPDTQTRLLLRVSVKLFALLGLLVVLYTLLSPVLTDSGRTPAPPLLRYPLEAMPDNQVTRIAWAGGNLVLVKRSAATLASLNAPSDLLLDPTSERANQPEGLPPTTRSARDDMFLAFDRGTDMPCPLSWIPPGNREAPQQPWEGGFRDSCRGSWYDAAGRVYKGQQAERNLDIPPHRFVGKDLLEIGASGDNAAPAN